MCSLECVITSYTQMKTLNAFFFFFLVNADRKTKNLNVKLLQE